MAEVFGVLSVVFLCFLEFGGLVGCLVARFASFWLRFQFPIKSFTSLTIPDVARDDLEDKYPLAFAWCPRSQAALY